jgi:hypothetical protein
MFLDLVYVCVSHLSQNVDMTTQSATVLKHLKPILRLLENIIAKYAALNLQTIAKYAIIGKYHSLDSIKKCHV